MVKSYEVDEDLFYCVTQLTNCYGAVDSMLKSNMIVYHHDGFSPSATTMM